MDDSDAGLDTHFVLYISEQGAVIVGWMTGMGRTTLKGDSPTYRAALPPFGHRLERFRKEGGNRQEASAAAAAGSATAQVAVRRRDLLFAANVILGRRPPDHVDVFLVVELHVF